MNLIKYFSSAGELTAEELERVVQIVKDPAAYKIPAWCKLQWMNVVYDMYSKAYDIQSLTDKGISSLVPTHMPSHPLLTASSVRISSA